jgi:YYY domain-containing protein
MLSFLLWYIIVSFVGLAVFPLAFRLLPALADRGYIFSRALGLLLWGYFFWLLASLRIVRNDIGGLVLAFGLLIALGIIAYLKLPGGTIRDWIQQNRRLIVFTEILFLFAFAGMAFVRAANPEILGTEKPMELAFINAILNSPEFPPHDPWLSGYAISYYYFGYVLIAMLAKTTLVQGSIAFNLGIALVFGLSASGAFGLVYNLQGALIARKPAPPSTDQGSPSLLYALFGPLFILLVSNLEGFLEVLHARGLFWKQGLNGELTSSFWTWIDMKELSLPPAQPFSWVPTRFYWWWRASRVLQDYDVAGNWKEIIDEFPFFSFLLGDLHPHVLAMPFAFLAMAVALNVFLGGGLGSIVWLRVRLHLSWPFFALAALVLGGLAFLNIWDFPIYVFLFAGAYALGKLQQQDLFHRSFRDVLKDFLGMGLALIVTGVILYLPFYFGFSSQAGGVLPNLVYSTRGAHLWVMFGALLIPLFAYLFYLWRRLGKGVSLRQGFFWAGGVLLTLWILALLLGLVIILLPQLGELFLGTLGSAGLEGRLLQEAFLRRFTSHGWVTLLVLLALTLSLLWPKRSQINLESDGPEYLIEGQKPWFYPPNSAHGFTLLLILVGVLLVIFPEFFFLRDQFGWRMNTIFKFYYQAWLLWGIAVAFGITVLLRGLKGLTAIVFRVGLIFLVGAALVYPFLGLWTKTSGFQPTAGFNLDGAAYFERQSPDEMAGIRWLRDASPGIIVEAVGSSYSDYARVATLSGLPNVLGWPGHESQWRGGNEEMGSRQSDIETIFRSGRWEEVKQILEKYGVRYVFVGPLEHSTYLVNEVKFDSHLKVVFRQGDVTIYEVPSGK